MLVQLFMVDQKVGPDVVLKSLPDVEFLSVFLALSACNELLYLLDVFRLGVFPVVHHIRDVAQCFRVKKPQGVVRSLVWVRLLFVFASQIVSVCECHCFVHLDRVIMLKGVWAQCDLLIAARIFWAKEINGRVSLSVVDNGRSLVSSKLVDARAIARLGLI